MKMSEFMQNCSACGGNWGAMLLSGIKRVFSDKYAEVEEHYNSMDFSHGGIEPFKYLCDWLTENGIAED